MLGVNRVTLLGNLGKDPEVRHLENGRTKVSFTLATNDTYKNKNGEKIVHTEWHNITLWSPLAEAVEKHLVKGKQVYVEGKLSNRSYADKEGHTKYVTEVVGQQVILLGGGKEANEFAVKDSEMLSEPTIEPGDDLPF
eukprot:gene138-187_t